MRNGREGHPAFIDGGANDAALSLLSPDDIRVAHFAPPAELARFVTQMYHFRCDSAHIQDVQPAALAHLILILEGDGVLKFADGHVDKVHPATIFGPGSAFAEFTFAGPLEHFGLALTPLGFVALTGKAANQYADRAVDASELIGPEISELVERVRIYRRDSNLRISDIVDQITDLLLARVRPIPAAHLRMIDAVLAWISDELDPDVEALYAQLPMSRSTASRLIARYFGSAPKSLMRKYRALRAATALVDPQLSDETRARIESLFYDQPHMIREIRQFTGRTPGSLDGDDARFLRIWLSKDNFRMLDSYPG